MSESQELQSIRIRLEEESRSLNDERKNLEEKVKVLREKVAVEELRRSNAVTRDIISKLRVEINELEQKLSEPLETSATNQQSQEIISESPAALNPDIPVAQQQLEAKKQEGKKRIFF